MYICPKCHKYIRGQKKENICINCRRQTTTFQYLHEIPNESIIRGLSVDGALEDIMFHRIDGMYSYCTVINGGYVCHLPADLKVINIEPGVWHTFSDAVLVPNQDTQGD